MLSQVYLEMSFTKLTDIYLSTFKWYVGMTVGDRRKSHKLDYHQAKGILAHRRKRDVGSISEAIIASFLESKSKRMDGFF